MNCYLNRSLLLTHLNAFLHDKVEIFLIFFCFMQFITHSLYKNLPIVNINTQIKFMFKQKYGKAMSRLKNNKL